MQVYFYSNLGPRVVRVDLEKLIIINSKLYIRASQGHSHGVASLIKEELLLTELKEPLE